MQLFFTGGVASFKPGHPIEHLKKWVFEGDGAVWQTNNFHNFSLPDLRVILVNSKVERNTARMVQTVKERLKKFPEVVDAMFGSIDAISLDAAKILHRPPLEENGGGDSASTVQVRQWTSGHTYNDISRKMDSDRSEEIWLNKIITRFRFVFLKFTFSNFKFLIKIRKCFINSSNIQSYFILNPERFLVSLLSVFIIIFCFNPFFIFLNSQNRVVEITLEF